MESPDVPNLQAKVKEAEGICLELQRLVTDHKELADSADSLVGSAALMIQGMEVESGQVKMQKNRALQYKEEIKESFVDSNAQYMLSLEAEFANSLKEAPELAHNVSQIRSLQAEQQALSDQCGEFARSVEAIGEDLAKSQQGSLKLFPEKTNSARWFGVQGVENKRKAVTLQKKIDQIKEGVKEITDKIKYNQMFEKTQSLKRSRERAEALEKKLQKFLEGALASRMKTNLLFTKCVSAGVFQQQEVDQTKAFMKEQEVFCLFVIFVFFSFFFTSARGLGWEGHNSLFVIDS